MGKKQIKIDQNKTRCIEDKTLHFKRFRHLDNQLKCFEFWNVS